MTKQQKEHPHAWALRQIADGVPVSEFEVRRTNWVEPLWDSAADWHSWFFSNPTEWQVRRKQKTIVVNDIEVPEPVREPLKVGEVYWICTGIDAVVEATWYASGFDDKRLALGLIHRTKKDAEAAREAMLAPFKPGEGV